MRLLTSSLPPAVLPSKVPPGRLSGRRPDRWPRPEQDRAFIATTLLTGLRLSELMRLDLGAIDSRPGERRTKVLGKGRKERTIQSKNPSSGSSTPT
jgi:integrase/recombinase XerD